MYDSISIEADAHQGTQARAQCSGLPGRNLDSQIVGKAYETMFDESWSE